MVSLLRGHGHHADSVCRGKHSGSMSNNLVAAIQSGASRNVYIGQITDFETFTEAKLREDFAEYGGELPNLVNSGRADVT